MESDAGEVNSKQRQETNRNVKKVVLIYIEMLGVILCLSIIIDNINHKLNSNLHSCKKSQKYNLYTLHIKKCSLVYLVEHDTDTNPADPVDSDPAGPVFLFK